MPLKVCASWRSETFCSSRSWALWRSKSDFLLGQNLMFHEDSCFRKFDHQVISGGIRRILSFFGFSFGVSWFERNHFTLVNQTLVFSSQIQHQLMKNIQTWFFRNIGHISWFISRKVAEIARGLQKTIQSVGFRIWEEVEFFESRIYVSGKMLFLFLSDSERVWELLYVLIEGN
jgi:hypothetical protein